MFFFLNKKKRRDHRNFNFHITYAIFNADLIHCHTWLPLPAENLWSYGNTNQQYKMRNKKCSKPLKYCYTQFNFYRGFYKAQLKKNTELPLISIKRRVVGNTVRICVEAKQYTAQGKPAKSYILKIRWCENERVGKRFVFYFASVFPNLCLICFEPFLSIC